MKRIIKSSIRALVFVAVLPALAIFMATLFIADAVVWAFEKE